MAARRAIIEPDHQELTISAQCELTQLPRTSYYRTPAPESEENLMLMRLIDEPYTAHPSMGSRSIRDRLRLRGHNVNRKRVQRLMNIMGIASLAPQKKKTTIPAPGHKILTCSGIWTSSGPTRFGAAISLMSASSTDMCFWQP